MGSEMCIRDSLGPVALHGHLEESKELFRLYGQRMATKTVSLFG